MGFVAAPRDKFPRFIPEALLADSLGDSRIGGGLIQGGMEGIAMPAAVGLREDYSPEELRALARGSKTINQSRRLLSLAAVRDGMDRGAAAKIGGMDRQTLRDWVHRFNASGPEGLIDNLERGSQASPFGGATGSVGADRRSRSGS